MIKFDLNNKNSFKTMLKHLNILYIEDEDNIRENITKTLEMFANKVFSVESTEEAIEILAKEKVDIIISDINLPKKSGIELIQEIRKSNCYIPVIFISAFTDRDYLLEATKLKLVDYLVKPIDFNILNDALLNACKDIINTGNYVVNFQDNTSYNVMHKKLIYNNTEDEIDLTAKEIELLEYLIANSNRIVSHDEIKTEIWEDSFEATDSALKNLLTKLRKKVGKDSIKNISGVGFRIHLI